MHNKSRFSKTIKTESKVVMVRSTTLLLYNVVLSN